jgi:hypothetical protein
MPQIRLLLEIFSWSTPLLPSKHSSLQLAFGFIPLRTKLAITWGMIGNYKSALSKTQGLKYGERSRRWQFQASHTQSLTTSGVLRWLFVSYSRLDIALTSARDGDTSMWNWNSLGRSAQFLKERSAWTHVRFDAQIPYLPRLSTMHPQKMYTV